MSARRFLLVHSPIVGSDTWLPVAEELAARGHASLVPTLADDGTTPFHRQHVASVESALDDLPPQAWTVAAHSGAGQLVGLLGARLQERGDSVDAYIFVDAGLPPAGQSRLAQLRAELPEFADELETLLVAGARFPAWSDEQLAGLVPDVERRARLRAGLRPLPAGFWHEEIPAAPGWPDAPCAVILLSGGYEATADHARRRAWPVVRLAHENHFFQLAQPEAVAHELVRLRDQFRR